MQQPATAVLWRRLDLPGTEYCALRPTGDGWSLQGTVCAAIDQAPIAVAYTVRCNDRWETTSVDVRQECGIARASVILRVDAERRWWQDGQELPALYGCVDIDLGITPSTNTLPIRRLSLPVGGAHAIDAAWIRFPDLATQVLPQRYTRVQERLYRYESLGTSFSAELSVDEHGLVIDYERLWERAAPPQA